MLSIAARPLARFSRSNSVRSRTCARRVADVARRGALVWSLLIAVPTMAAADAVPFSCTVLPDGLSASVMLTNPFDHDASCLATCQFSTAKYDVRPQITCSKTVPAGKQVQMCILSATGEKLLALTDSHGDCVR